MPACISLNGIKSNHFQSVVSAPGSIYFQKLPCLLLTYGRCWGVWALPDSPGPLAGSAFRNPTQSSVGGGHMSHWLHWGLFRITGVTLLDQTIYGGWVTPMGTLALVWAATLFYDFTVIHMVTSSAPFRLAWFYSLIYGSSMQSCRDVDVNKTNSILCLRFHFIFQFHAMIFDQRHCPDQPSKRIKAFFLVDDYLCFLTRSHKYFC